MSYIVSFSHLNKIKMSFSLFLFILLFTELSEQLQLAKVRKT